MAHFEYSTDSGAFHRHDYAIDAWTNATLYIGISAWSKLAEDKSLYMEWLHNIGTECNWNIANNFTEYPEFDIYHADELCIGQFYLDMYDIYKEEYMITSTHQRIEQIMNSSPDTNMSHQNKQVWSWCDALFMAPPVYCRMAAIYNKEEYIDYMDKQFRNTVSHLYGENDSLFYRDDSYFGKKELNGNRIFWGRGNGWVAAGLVNLLKTLPEDSSYRPYYEDLFHELVCRLANLQHPDGFWHASLLDTDNYPSPETSATALITYALAYGLNKGILDKDTYRPIVEKAWRGLVASIDENGKLGWVQPIGADPKKVTKEMTAVFGVGAFLMAGCEIYHLADNQ